MIQEKGVILYPHLATDYRSLLLLFTALLKVKFKLLGRYGNLQMIWSQYSA
jgi:hypothetical protein